MATTRMSLCWHGEKRTKQRTANEGLNFYTSLGKCYLPKVGHLSRQVEIEGGALTAREVPMHVLVRYCRHVAHTLL